MDNYAEFIDLGKNRMMVFALVDENDGRAAWSIGTTSDSNVQVSIGNNGANSVEALRELKKTVDGALKHIVAKQKDYVAKGKVNDEPTI